MIDRDSNDYNFIARACMVCGAYRSQQNKRDATDELQYNLTRINVDYRTAVVIARRLKKKAGDIVNAFNGTFICGTDPATGILVELTTGSEAKQEGPFVQFPDFTVKYLGRSYDAHASTSACMGDSHSKIFMRLKTSAKSGDDVRKLSKDGNRIIESLITKHLFPAYTDILKNSLCKNKGFSINIEAQDYYPVQTSDDLPQSATEVFEMIKQNKLESLTTEFSKNSDLFSAVKKHILKPLGLFKLDSKNDIDWQEYNEQKLTEMKKYKWKFQAVGSGDQTLYLQQETDSGQPKKHDLRYAGLTIPRQSNSVNISSSALINSLVAGQ